jgi:glycosyltransferase involved in cell wall biosynthesis
MIVDSLERELEARGVAVDVVRIPHLPSWRLLPSQTLALRLFDLSESVGGPIDRLITIRYPSYALRHPNKVAWFIHHHRGAYDLWGTPFQDIPITAEGQQAREALVRSDTLYLREARKIFTNSRTVAERLRTFNGIEPDGVLYPPLPHAELFHPGEFGGYFVYAARLTPTKRQRLAIEAMRFVRSRARLLLIGSAEFAAFRLQLEEMIRRHGLGKRVHLLGWLSEEEKARLTTNACGALYVAYDEDSYGYSTLEAFHAHKPIITLTDSGGPLEVVQDSVNGIVVEPDARAIAAAIDQLWFDRERARRLGERAFASLESMGISWDNVIDQLLTS